MRYRNLVLHGLLVGCLCSYPSLLQAEPKIEVDYNPSQAITIGKTCEQTIQVTWKSQEADYLFPMPEIPAENFVIEEQGESNEVFQKGGKEWKKKTFHSAFKATRVGKGRLGPFRLTYIDPAKQLGGHFEVPLREFKIARDPSRLYQGGAIALGLAVVGLMSAWVIRNRKRQQGQSTNTSSVSLEDEFITRLNRLKQDSVSSSRDRGPLLEAGKLFRTYLGNKYAVSTTQPTCQEMTEKMRERVTPEEFKNLKRILEGLDDSCYANPPREGGVGINLLDEMIRYIEGKRTVAF